jgi:hypothetical protein
MIGHLDLYLLPTESLLAVGGLQLGVAGLGLWSDVLGLIELHQVETTLRSRVQ